MQPVFRFAPSPNGFLHLGHAYSALLNARMAREAGGRFLLRIEDIDTARCRADYVAAIFEDLAWLGLVWEEPVLRQSQHFGRYQAVAARLRARVLLYTCFCTRSEIAQKAGESPARDPDGAPVYPGTCRGMHDDECALRIARGEAYALRLDLAAALAMHRGGALTWQETGAGGARIEPAVPEAWGDVVLVRKDIPTSYHLAVVLDDAMQGVTHVVRGRDLFDATAIHRLLQDVLDLPAPVYHHHRLLNDADGRKLSKSQLSVPLRQLRQEGVTPEQIRAALGFSEARE